MGSCQIECQKCFLKPNQYTFKFQVIERMAILKVEFHYEVRRIIGRAQKGVLKNIMTSFRRIVVAVSMGNFQ